MTQSNQTTDTGQKPKGRLTLIIIFTIAFVPMMLATYMYFNHFMVPAGRTNKGTLILPPLEFDRLALAEQTGQPLRIADMEEKWRLLILSDGSCDEQCREALYKARQVNVALHKEAQRVTRYYVDASVDGSGVLDDDIQTQYPQLNQVTADRFRLKQYLDEKIDGNSALGQNHILVVDPIGNIMMFYNAENSGKDILEDLKRLLKVSHIG